MLRRHYQKRKSGLTLLEVMLAGAMVSIATLAMMEGFIVSMKIVHENAETLQADGVAFDLLWRKFYGDYDHLTSTVGRTVEENETNSSTSPYYSSRVSDVDLPDFKYTESVSNAPSGKFLSIDLKYGTNDRFSRHLEVFRSEIPRTSN